jgi:trimeric autotransporter adhesin
MNLRPVRTLVFALALSATVLAGQAAHSPAGAATTVASTPSPSDGANERVNVIVRAGDRIFVGGAFTAVGGQPRGKLAALDAATGRVIADWRADVGGEVYALAPSPDGSVLYVGGDFSSVMGYGRKRLAAVSTSTGAVTAWNPGASGGDVRALAATAVRVYVGGKFSDVGGVHRPYLAAVTAGGDVDAGFNANPGNDVSALALSPDRDRLYATGEFHTVGGDSREHLAALNPDSGNALGWNPDATCPGLALDVTASDVYVGCGGGPGHPTSNSVSAWSASSGAREWIAATNGNVPAVARVGGAVYAGGHFSKVRGTTRKKAAAFDADSGDLEAWDPHPDSVLGVRSMLADGDSLWIGGDFTAISGTPQPHLAHFR